MTYERMRDIAYALRQQDPFNWIRRLREFNRETEPPRISTELLNKIITEFVVRREG